MEALRRILQFSCKSTGTALRLPSLVHTLDPAVCVSSSLWLKRLFRVCPLVCALPCRDYAVRCRIVQGNGRTIGEPLSSMQHTGERTGLAASARSLNNLGRAGS